MLANPPFTDIIYSSMPLRALSYAPTTNYKPDIHNTSKEKQRRNTINEKRGASKTARSLAGPLTNRTYKAGPLPLEGRGVRIW
jgi:hypothetical protein